MAVGGGEEEGEGNREEEDDDGGDEYDDEEEEEVAVLSDPLVGSVGSVAVKAVDVLSFAKSAGVSCVAFGGRWVSASMASQRNQHAIGR